MIATCVPLILTQSSVAWASAGGGERRGKGKAATDADVEAEGVQPYAMQQLELHNAGDVVP
jgi:hypothetical protein